MKKLFTLMTAAAASLSVMATDYTDQLEVSINGEAVTQTAKISVDKQDNGKYKLQLHNFVLVAGEDVMPIGNIDLADVDATTTGELTTLKFADNILLTDGDDTSVDMWMGPLLGPVPVDMTAEIRGEKLYTVININMESLQQIIRVTFGNGGYQIGNAGFEDFHTASVSNGSTTKTSDEPNNWHSFMSATSEGLSSTLAWIATNTPHTFISDVTRPGSTGSKSALVTSTSILGIVANGTITTGRLNAGSISADNVANHSWCCADSTETDANGDPFYTELNGLPDSLAVWVKFVQGTPNEQYPYATISAAITDGTYYQDPEDKDYDNVIARAKNNTITTNAGEWQKVTIPFTYEEGIDEATMGGRKCLLATISTNATPGKGSIDSLYVDDIQLIYGSQLTGITVKGQSIGTINDGVYAYEYAIDGEISADDIACTSDSKGIRTSTAIAESDGGVTVTITATSADLKENNVYTVNIKGATSGIASAKANDSKVVATYDLKGQRIDNAKAGQVVITKHADGKTMKSVKTR